MRSNVICLGLNDKNHTSALINFGYFYR